MLDITNTVYTVKEIKEDTYFYPMLVTSLQGQNQSLVYIFLFKGPPVFTIMNAFVRLSTTK